MSDTEDDGFNEDTFKNIAEEQAPVADAQAQPDAPSEAPKVDDPKPAEEPNKDEEPAKAPEETPPVGTDEKKEEEDAKSPETPEAPATPEASTPLTKDDVTAIISNLRNEERTSGKELETTTQEVLEAYYPDGLSNVLVDEKSGRELRTPQDVIEASGNTMSNEDAAQWLMNEQFKLDKQVAEIRDGAQKIAETTVNFRRDAIAAVQKYEPLFKQYPALQQKVFDKLKKQVKVDEAKGVILSAPDVMEHYDDYLEPYRLAFEYAQKQPATAATPDLAATPKPSAEDRMDEGGDAGATPPNDPNDFAQQVSKELAKGI